MLRRSLINLSSSSVWLSAAALALASCAASDGDADPVEGQPSAVPSSVNPTAPSNTSDGAGTTPSVSPQPSQTSVQPVPSGLGGAMGGTGTGPDGTDTTETEDTEPAGTETGATSTDTSTDTSESDEPGGTATSDADTSDGDTIDSGTSATDTSDTDTSDTDTSSSDPNLGGGETTDTTDPDTSDVDTGTGSSDTGMEPGEPSGGPRTMGYVGCSMSDNVAAGYAAVGGERVWPSLPAYWGQVVQDWANPNDEVWSTFDAQVDMFGVPSAVWIMVCIFNPPGVTLDEMKQIISLVRQRAPDATIYTTGQPLYEPGADCSIAGANGPQLTDDMAKQVAEDASLENVEYAGTFGPLSAAQKADVCHANDAGQRLLGEQAVEKWGM